jgi:fatty acid desaturase
MEDPKLTDSMESAPFRSTCHIVIGVAGIVAGLLLVLLGAVLQGLVPNILVGVLGFAITIIGGRVTLHHTSGGSNKAADPAVARADEEPDAQSRYRR